MTDREKDAYLTLCAEFPLVKLRDDEALLEAWRFREANKDRLAAAGQYDHTLLHLIQDYVHRRLVEFRDGGTAAYRRTDATVLRFMLATPTSPALAGEGVRIETLTRLSGVPTANLRAVLAGARTLERAEVARLESALAMSGIFSRWVDCGRTMATRKRFEVYPLEDNMVSVYDNATRRTTAVRFVLERLDCEGKACVVHPDAVGYGRDVELALNSDEAATERLLAGSAAVIDAPKEY